MAGIRLESATQAAEVFFDALESGDLDTLSGVVDEDVVETIPLSPSGDSRPFAVYRGKDEVLGYLNSIITNFSNNVLSDKQFFATAQDDIVFVEGNGQLVANATQAPYRNVYVFKIRIHEGLIIEIKEYANPVTYAQMAGMEIG